eukprot:gene56812-biopygen53292
MGLRRAQLLEAQSGEQQLATGSDPRNPFQAQWTAVPLRQIPAGPPSKSRIADDDQVSLLADLSTLNGRKPLAVRLAWPLFDQSVGSADDSCCTSEDVESGLAPCVPGNCPLYTSASELPANPFFAVIKGDKCTCAAPQDCGH